MSTYNMLFVEKHKNTHLFSQYFPNTPLVSGVMRSGCEKNSHYHRIPLVCKNIAYQKIWGKLSRLFYAAVISLFLFLFCFFFLHVYLFFFFFSFLNFSNTL